MVKLTINKEIVEYIDQAIRLRSDFIKQFRQEEKEDGFLKVMTALKYDITVTGKLRLRVLRGLKDIATTTAIHFEDEEYAQPFYKVLDFFETLPGWSTLPLLRMDFGNGDPI